MSEKVYFKTGYESPVKEDRQNDKISLNQNNNAGDNENNNDSRV